MHESYLEYRCSECPGEDVLRVAVAVAIIVIG